MKNIDYWRVLEPIILGTIANITINYIFDPKNPDFVLDEFLFAFVFATIVTEINHKINTRLDKKYSWTHNLGKRFSLHLAYLTITLLFLLNVIGNLYLWIIGDGFHTLREILIINLSVFVIALFLTFLKWSIHFYQNWRSTEHHLNDYTQKFDDLKSEIIKSEQMIELQKGNSLYKINASDIIYAKIEHGIVWVYFDKTNKGVFHGTLNNLKQLLPDYLFYQVNRNIVIHKDGILAISSSTYGKIDVELKEEVLGNSLVTVSRPKASSFRKWYNSNSI